MSQLVSRSPSPTCHPPRRPVCNLRSHPLVASVASSRRVPPPHTTTHPTLKHTVATIRYPLPHHQPTPPNLLPPSLSHLPFLSLPLSSRSLSRPHLASPSPTSSPQPVLGALLGRVCQPFASASTLLRETRTSLTRCRSEACALHYRHHQIQQPSSPRASEPTPGAYCRPRPSTRSIARGSYYSAELCRSLHHYDHGRRSTAVHHLVLSCARPPSLAATLRPRTHLCSLRLTLQRRARAVEATEK